MNQDIQNFFYVASQVHGKLEQKELRLTLPERKWHMTQKQYLEKIRLETNKIENIPSLIFQLQQMRTKANQLTEIVNRYIRAMKEDGEELFLLYANTTKNSIVEELMYGDSDFYEEDFTTSISISDWYKQLTALLNESRNRINFFRNKISTLSKAYSKKVIEEVIDELKFGIDYERAILYSLPYSIDDTPEDQFVYDVILELHNKGQLLKLVIYKDEVINKTSYHNRFIAIPGKTKIIYR